MTPGRAVVVVIQDLFLAVRLSDALHAMGCKGVTVQHHSELHETLKAVKPHLIILDLQVRDIRVHDVMAAARESVPGRPIPVLAFAPQAATELRSQALSAGCHRVVTKSLIASELSQLVQSMLPRR